ncbi:MULTISPECIES: EAL domain-containing protein [unclassified Rathayibacter]|uniref:EAL domain-containing protein n=1 Tax=unclassified Rathayibacter TaxID=2609250 RepID=UPI00188C899F|nr:MULTISPECIES: bifunctional diguanylate cyclase/phosphodiesterase [unclassified Rathayibacter]MBF4461249.1 bifunctional diguanylate cyclase/phosphodiesterase [Rathayibacter sp. VKM Ac-2879]MBF4502660.1 bifunctional diguanylate cyclase/phosphodiesterase [Rathayibacter sp. VKM Ac-2878]
MSDGSARTGGAAPWPPTGAADPTAPAIPGVSSTAIPESSARPVRALRLAVAIAGVVLVLVLLVPHAAILPGLWLPFLVAVVAMWLTGPFRLELAWGIGTVTFGVGVAVLAFLAGDVGRVPALLLWVLALAVLQIAARRPPLAVAYAVGLASLSGGAFLLVLSLLPATGWWPTLAAVPAVLAYGAIAIGIEYAQARIALAGLPDVPPPTLRPGRVALALALNAGLVALAYGARLSSGVQRIDFGAGLDIRSANTLLIVALGVAVVSQQLRRARLERKLNGLIEASLALPWGEQEEIFESLERAAAKTVPSASARISESEGRPFELSAPVTAPGVGVRHVVLTRRPDSGGFTVLEQRALLALAHIATQALYDRRNTRALRDQATTDAVTGLTNLRGLYEEFDALDEPGRSAMLFLDLDDFKAVNDTHGHSTGNIVLEHVGRRIRESVRAEDVVARIGGDEFAVLVDSVTASAVAHRIVRAVERPLVIGRVTLHPRISVGAPVEVSGSFDRVMQEADERMYASKNQRKSERAEGADLVAEVRTAVLEGTVRVAFQPVIDVAERTIIGFEALARCTTADGTPLSPLTLVDIARSLGLLDRLTVQILDQAVESMLEFREIDAAVSFLSVNIEAEQLMHDEILDTVRSHRTAERGIQLCLELTEGSIGHVDEAVIERVRALTADGIAIALDDYGQEHAAAAALLTVPLSIVKIDRVFLSDEANPRHATILRSIIDLVADLDMHPIVEGVETPTAHALLTRLRAERAQGYFYGRPLFPELVKERLRATGTAALPDQP